MIFEIFKQGRKVGETEADSALQARLRAAESFGSYCLSAVLKEEVQGPKSKVQSPIAPAASPDPKSPETGNLETKRAQPHATSGEGALNANPPGSTPRPKRAKRPIDKPTHSNRRKGKFVRKQRETRKRCQDKERYPNSQVAHEAILGLVKRKDRHRKKNLHAYRCPRCHGWHIHS